MKLWDIKLAIFNDKEEMLIQKIQLNKQKFPNLWDFSVTGEAINNETSDETAERELFEKLGVKYDFSRERPMVTIHNENGFTDFYILNMNINEDSLKIQYEDIQSITWASKQEIFQLIDEEKFVPYTKAIIELIFFNKDCRGIINNGI